MLELINAFDSYHDFGRTAYYTLCYNSLPSHIRFETPIKESKETMEAVIASFDFERLKLKAVFKNWSTEDDKNSDSKDDYPFQYLLKSDIKNLIIWVSIDNNELYVEMLYDVSDQELEKEVIAINNLIRTSFGEKKSPTFKVLSHNSNHFYTEDVKTEDLEINIEELYNDDFQGINAIIEESMLQERSGLILLHGTPGTGKTSYIKNLITKFRKNTFIFVQNEFIKDLLNPDFISFLLKNRNAILIIEDAEKVITSRESVNESSVVSTILQLTDGLFSDFLNIKIICTFNTNINKVDKALLRKGRMIANYEFKPLSIEKSNKILAANGYVPNDEEMALADIFNYDKRTFDTTSKAVKIGFQK